MNKAWIVAAAIGWPWIAAAQTPVAQVPQWACGAIGFVKVVPGQDYQPGDYYVQLQGGAGQGAAVHLSSAGGKIGGVRFGIQGQGYKTGDELTGAIPGGKGFKLIVLATRPMPLDKNGYEWVSNDLKLRWPDPPCPPDE